MSIDFSQINIIFSTLSHTPHNR